ncbi:MAG: hypothetical protein ABI920_03790 [Casimicrobiaceae bacterium]
MDRVGSAGLVGRQLPIAVPVGAIEHRGVVLMIVRCTGMGGAPGVIRRMNGE